MFFWLKVIPFPYVRIIWHFIFTEVYEVYEIGNQKLPSITMTEKFAVEVDEKFPFGKSV